MKNNIFEHFGKYLTTGIANTLIHWIVFAIVFHFCRDQSISNLSGFVISVTFSFIVNAKFTFKSKINSKKYISYISFMGILSYTVGWLGMKLNLPALITLCLFSVLSLFVGFIYSKYIIFKKEL